MITVDFSSLEDMMDFAKKLGGFGQAITSENHAEAVNTPVATKAPEQPKAQAAPPVTQATPVQSQPTPPAAQPRAPMQVTPPPVQTTATNYKMDDLAGAAMTLMDSGRQPELLNLLSQFGVDALPSLPQEQYGAFATALRGLGAQI